MMKNKKVIEGAVVVTFALVVTITAAVNGSGSSMAEFGTKEVAAEEEVVAASKEKADVEWVAAAVDRAVETKETIVEPATETGEVQPASVAEEAQPEQATEAGEVQPAPEETAAQPVEAVAEPVEEVSEWASRLMPNVKEYLNIRTEASGESEVVGKLYKGAAADILERGEEWTRISSGSVEGYVKNEYCVFDAEAEAMANEQGTVYATSLTDGLRVREQAGTGEDVSVLKVLEEGKKIKVDTKAEAPEGWVAVICSDQTAYVSAEYVSVELELGKAISIEEELEAIRKAEKEKAEKEAAKQRKQASRSQKESVAASYDDVTLLGALIQCEAGGECYEGQLAVGAVVMNRLRSGWAGSISGVIYQSGQFTPASSGKLARRLEKGVDSSCLQAAQEALNGVDNVDGAVYFRSSSSSQSGIVIGCHVFY